MFWIIEETFLFKFFLFENLKKNEKSSSWTDEKTKKNQSLY